MSDPEPLNPRNEKNEPGRIPTLVQSKHLWYVGLVLASLLVGAVMTVLPYKMMIAFPFLFPALLVLIYIILNPYAGVLLYYLFEYLRPQSFIPAMRPLRLSLLITIATVVSWLIHVAVKKQSVYWSKLNWLFLSFLAVIASTILTAINNRLAFNCFQIMLITLLIAFLTSNVIDTAKRLKKLIWLLLLVHFYLALSGLYNFVVLGYVVAGQQTSGQAGSAYFADENDFALALNVIIPFVFVWLFSLRSIWKKVLLGLMLLFLVIGVIASNSRGGLLGLAIVILLCIIVTRHKFAGIAIVGGLVVAVFAFAPQSYWEKMDTIKNPHEGTAQARINYWKAGLRMWRDYPITGVGAGNGPIRMPEYAVDFALPATQWGRTFHGTLPQVAAELGSLGLLIYLLLIIGVARDLMRVIKTSEGENGELLKMLSKALLIAIGGYFVTATFLSTAYYPQLWTLYAIAIVLKRLSDSEQKTASQLLMQNQ